MQIADRQVDRALERLESDTKALLSAGLLTPEQVERLTAVGRETDPHAKVAMVGQLSQQLLDELDGARAKLAELKQQLGVADGAGILDGGRLSADARQRLTDALQRTADEVRLQAKSQAELHAGGPTSPPAPGGGIYV